MTRSGVKNYLREEVDEEDKIMDDVLKKVDQKVLSSLGIKDGNKSRSKDMVISAAMSSSNANITSRRSRSARKDAHL